MVGRPHGPKWTSVGQFVSNHLASRGVYTTALAPLLDVGLSPDVEVAEQKSYGVYHLPWKARKKGVHHRVYIEASDPEKEKRRVSTVVVYTFFFPVLVLNVVRNAIPP